jgi:hypothetical protein
MKKYRTIQTKFPDQVTLSEKIALTKSRMCKIAFASIGLRVMSGKYWSVVIRVFPKMIREYRIVVIRVFPTIIKL